MTIEIEECRMESLATAPTFTNEERADATTTEERNRIQNLREQKLMNMLEHICVEVSNMSKAIQNLNLTKPSEPNLNRRVELLEANVAMLMAQARRVWQPKDYQAPPTPNYAPGTPHYGESDFAYRRPFSAKPFGEYDQSNFNTGFNK